MPAARGIKRTASKASAASASSTSATPVTKNKKKRGVQLEVPTAPKKLGRVFTCGQGDVGQLGLGEDVVETTKFKCVSALGSKVVDACAGGMHTVALDTDGKVWTFGCNDEGALGRPTSGETDEGTPKRVSLPHPAVAITAGDSHSAALLNNGEVYAWGAFRDSHGSMGLVVRGREGKLCREPVQIEIGEPAVGIASGGDHLVVLSSSGSVYTMGCGEQGQLGRLSQRSASRNARQGFASLLTPSKVNVKGGASRVWAGYHATFALDSNDKMFAWGLNNYGQLGITGEKRKVALYAPVECDAFTSAHAEWRIVCCGQHHSLALDAAGQVYAIGRCEYGRLGLGERSGDADTLEPVPKLQNKTCISISAGTSNSFAVTDNGEILSWGMGSEGQLGTGASVDASEPVPAVVVAGDKAGHLTPLRVSAGGQHTVIFMEDSAAQREPSPAPEMETAEEKVEEDSEEKEEIEEQEEEAPRAKRQKKKEQVEEVTSTSTPAKVNEDKEKPKARKKRGAQSTTADRDGREKKKVNGDKKKETAMEVDETDNTDDKKEDTATDNKTEETEKDIETKKSKTTERTEGTERTESAESAEGTTEKTSRETAPNTDTDSDTKTSTKEHKQETKQSIEDTPEPMDETPPSPSPTQTQTQTDNKIETDTKETVANDVEMQEKPEVNGTQETEVVEPKSVDLIPTGTAVTTSA